MATDHTHVVEREGDGGMSMFLWGILLIILVLLFFRYGIPIFQGGAAPQTNPGVNVPEQVDVNVNQK